MNSKSTPEIIRRAVQDLKHGDHVIYALSPVDDAGVYEVGQVGPYLDYADVPMVAAFLTPVVGGEPAMLRRSHGEQVVMATKDDVAAAVAQRDREQVIRDLYRLIALIRDEELVIAPYGGPDISVRLADGQVSRLAVRLGVETTAFGSAERRVVWPVRESYGQLSVVFHGKPAVEPAAVPEVVPAEPGSDANQAVNAVRYPAIPHSCTADGCSVCNLFPAPAGE